ncbi:hypothetical protein ACJX0J_005750, partial [Zea mays]
NHLGKLSSQTSPRIAENEWRAGDEGDHSTRVNWLCMMAGVAPPGARKRHLIAFSHVLCIIDLIQIRGMGKGYSFF